MFLVSVVCRWVLTNTTALLQLPGRFKDSPADEQIQWQDIRRKVSFSLFPVLQPLT